MLTRIVFLILLSIIVSGSIRIGFELRDSILYGDDSFVRDALKNGPIGHINWVSYKKEKPKKYDIYLFLIKEKKRNKMFVKSIAYFDGSILSVVFDGTDPQYEIIAWADPNNIAFDCNPEHYHECGKKDCDISNDCSTCHKTVKLEHAKWIDWFI